MNEHSRHHNAYYQEVVDCSLDFVDLGLTESLNLDEFPPSSGMNELRRRNDQLE